VEGPGRCEQEVQRDTEHQYPVRPLVCRIKLYCTAKASTTKCCFGRETYLNQIHISILIITALIMI
jgi:hypothetical protein